MGERAIDPRLQELFDKGIQPTSISRCNCINNCEYEAYITYKLGRRGRNNIYGILGGRTHEVLEDITNGRATEADLLPAVELELADMDMLGIEFPKDFKGEDSVRKGWITDMTHFCETYKAPRNSGLSTEELFIYKTDKDVYLQGYIDLQYKHKDGSIDIYDYKTSSMYSKADLLDHGRQLVIYKLGLEQMGLKVNKVAWIFLKYVDISFMGKKTIKSKEKTLLTKTVERRKIGTEMAKYIEQDLYEAGYDDLDSDIYLDEFKKSNKFDCLPEEIKKLYTMKPCVVEYEVTSEIEQECIDYINNTMIYWNTKDDDPIEYSHRPFTKEQKNGKTVDDIYYCTALCAHFDECPHIQDYLATKQNKSEDEFADLF